MAQHTYKVGKRTLVYYDTKEEIGGNPGQSKLVPVGYEPMSGNYMVIAPFNAIPWVVAGFSPNFSHSGSSWKEVYASGGFKGKELYTSQEPGFKEAANPSYSSRLANQEINRESERHLGDLTIKEISDRLDSGTDRSKFRDAVESFTSVGYDVSFYEHELNRPTEDEPDPVSICFGVSQLASRDRNVSVSERVSIQRWEDLRTFLDSSTLVMSQMESGSIRDGFCLVKLHGFGHTSATKNRNDKNCRV